MDKYFKFLVIAMLFVIIYLCYENRKIKENMTDVTSVKEHINKIYKADIESIRNLEQVAKKLQEGKLTIPGNLTVEGELVVDKNSTVKGNSKIKGDIKSDGKIHSKGDIKSDRKIHSKGDIKSDGNGYFGPAYIGKYNKTDSNYAQFSHIKNTSLGNYSILQGKGGETFINASRGKNVTLRNSNADRVTMNSNGDLTVSGDLNVKNLNARGIKGYYYIRSSDANLYIHTQAGSKNKHKQTLHPCPKGSNHPNCQWQFQRSTTK